MVQEGINSHFHLHQERVALLFHERRLVVNKVYCLLARCLHYTHTTPICSYEEVKL